MNSLLIASAFLLIAPVDEARQPPERDPSTMTGSEIATFNQGLERNHPQYISCQKTDVVGSLVRKMRVCRTKVEWVRAGDIGNENARDIADAMRRAPVNGN